MAPVPVVKLIIGSGMVFTFLKARSHSAGYHQAEDDLNELVTKLKEQAKAMGVKAILPSGGTCAVEDTFDSWHEDLAVKETCEVIKTDTEKLTCKYEAQKRNENLATKANGEVARTDIEKLTCEYSAQKLNGQLAVEKTSEATIAQKQEVPKTSEMELQHHLRMLGEAICAAAAAPTAKAIKTDIGTLTCKNAEQKRNEDLAGEDTCEATETDIEKLTCEYAEQMQIEDLAVEATREVIQTDIEKLSRTRAAQKAEQGPG